MVRYRICLAADDMGKKKKEADNDKVSKIQQRSQLQESRGKCHRTQAEVRVDRARFDLLVGGEPIKMSFSRETKGLAGSQTLGSPRARGSKMIFPLIWEKIISRTASAMCLCKSWYTVIIFQDHRKNRHNA